MKVEIKPHVGTQRDASGKIVEGQDTGIDCVCLVSKEWPVPKRVGFIQRGEGGVVVFTVQISDSDKAAVMAEVEKRKGAAVSTDAVPLRK